MSGGDPALHIAGTLPHTTREQVTAVLSAIHRRPRREWLLLARMLGLTGEPFSDPQPAIKPSRKK